MGIFTKRDANYGSKDDTEHRIEKTGKTTRQEDYDDIRQAAKEAHRITRMTPVPSTREK
jgi:hypothetical protein